MNENASHDAYCRQPSASCDADFSVALVSPNEFRRAAAVQSAAEICEFSSFLSTPADLARLAGMNFDVILVDIDDDTFRALKLVETLSSDPTNRVLVYSSDRSPEMLARCMGTGARDFLAFPFERDAVMEAFGRLFAEEPAPSGSKRYSGSRKSAWRSLFDTQPLTRSLARP